jgi:hypothetical protein
MSVSLLSGEQESALGGFTSLSCSVWAPALVLAWEQVLVQAWVEEAQPRAWMEGVQLRALPVVVQLRASLEEARLPASPVAAQTQAVQEGV